MRAEAEEFVECPVCGTLLRERRPPFRLSPNRFNCSGCNALLRFSDNSQKRIMYVIIFVGVFGPAAFYAGKILGPMATVIAALAGAFIALGLMVWQGKVPQLEVID